MASSTTLAAAGATAEVIPASSIDAAVATTLTVTTIFTTVHPTPPPPPATTSPPLSPSPLSFPDLLLEDLDHNFSQGIQAAFAVAVAAVVAAGILLCGLAHGWPGILRFLSRCCCCRRRSRRERQRRSQSVGMGRSSKRSSSSSSNVFSFLARVAAGMRIRGRSVRNGKEKCEEDDDDDMEGVRGRSRRRAGYDSGDSGSSSKRLQRAPPGYLQIQDDGAGVGAEVGVEEVRGEERLTMMMEREKRGEGHCAGGGGGIYHEENDDESDGGDQAEEPLFQCGMRTSSRKTERLLRQQSRGGGRRQWRLTTDNGHFSSHPEITNLDIERGLGYSENYQHHYYDSGYGYGYNYGYDDGHHHDSDYYHNQQQKRTTRFFGIPRFWAPIAEARRGLGSSSSSSAESRVKSPGANGGLLSRLFRHLRVLYFTRNQYDELQVWPTSGQQQQHRNDDDYYEQLQHQHQYWQLTNPSWATAATHYGPIATSYPNHGYHSQWAATAEGEEGGEEGAGLGLHMHDYHHHQLDYMDNSSEMVAVAAAQDRGERRDRFGGGTTDISGYTTAWRAAAAAAPTSTETETETDTEVVTIRIPIIRSQKQQQQRDIFDPSPVSGGGYEEQQREAVEEGEGEEEGGEWVAREENFQPIRKPRLVRLRLDSSSGGSRSGSGSSSIPNPYHHHHQSHAAAAAAAVEVEGGGGKRGGGRRRKRRRVVGADLTVEGMLIDDDRRGRRDDNSQPANE